MGMKIRGFFLTLLFLGCALCAKPEAAEKPTPHPFPQGLLIQRRGANFSTWTITCTSATSAIPGETGAVVGQDPKAKVPKFLRRITVTRTGNILNEVIVDAKGQRQETWLIGKYQFTTFPGSDERVEIDKKDEGQDEPYDVFSKTDFPDFGWITQSEYVDIQDVSGRKCIVYKMREAASSGNCLRGFGNPPPGPSADAGRNAYLPVQPSSLDGIDRSSRLARVAGETCQTT